MTFDEAFKAEAERMFERAARLERSTDGCKTWVPLGRGPAAEAVYHDKSRACELASAHGVQMTDGSSIRFVVPSAARLKSCRADLAREAPKVLARLDAEAATLLRGL